MLKRKFQFLLLVAVVLMVFYPSIFAELNSIDDVGMVTSLLNMEDWSLRGLFLPHVGGGLYYRPLLILSFIWDKYAWFLSASFMHLENVLLHLLNGVLVFLVAEELLLEQERKASYLPLVSAMCFLLHPLITEPVNWVSGRTDVMAGTFVLLSALSLLKLKTHQRKFFLVFSGVALLCGMMSKEVAVAFLPGALFILIAKVPVDSPNVDVEAAPGHRWGKKEAFSFAVIVSLSVLCFYMLRSHAFTGNSPRIKMTLKFIFNDLGHATFVFLRTFGFYMKKLYWPFPLSFAIVEVDPLYELLAMPLVVGCVVIAWKRTLLSAIFTAGVFMIFPAFPIAYNQVAWTPYAERYIYIASGFVVVATVLYLGQKLRCHESGMLGKVGIFSLCLFLAVTTFLRNLTWQTNVALYQDTVSKASDFSKVWNELGIAYYNKKDFRKAEAAFIKASSLYSLYYDEKSDLNLAITYIDQGKLDKAEDVYSRVLKKGGDKSELILDNYIEFLQKKKERLKNKEEMINNLSMELEYTKRLHLLTKNPLLLYRMGELAEAVHDMDGARRFYTQACDKLPPGDKHIKSAKLRLAEIEQR